MSGSRRRTKLLVGGALVAAASVPVVLAATTSSPAAAAPFDVETTSRTDDESPGDGVCADAAGECSLRAALMEANALGESAEIVLPEGTFFLTGPFDIENDVTITAAPAAATRPVIDLEDGLGFFVRNHDLVIDGVDMIGGLDVDERGGAAIRAEQSVVTIRNSTFSNHRSDVAGGAILSAYGVLEIEGSVFESNFSSAWGGAVAAIGGDLLVSTATFRGNGASAGGGAVHASSTTRLDLGGTVASPSRFESNTALDQGGAVYVEGAPDPSGPNAKIGPATFVGNSAGNEGGAVFIGRSRGDHRTLVTDCVFTDNIGLVGGAIAIDFAAVDIDNCVFTGNQSVGGSGGAVASGGSVTLTDVDFDGNQADGDGGGLAANGPTEVSGSTFVDNRATGRGGALSTSGEAVPVIGSSSMTNNAADEGAGAIWRVGSTFDTSGVTGSGNQPAGPLLEVAPAGAPDPDDPVIPDPGPPIGAVTPVTPARLADTRPDEQTIDGQIAGVGPVRTGQVLRIPVHGRGGVPESATAVVVNLAAVGPTARGYLTLFPCDEPVPSTASVNYGRRPVDVNGAVVKLSASGALCVFSLAQTHVVLDVNAYAEADEAVVPKRIAESRAGLTTDDGRFASFGRLSAGSVVEIEVAGRGGVPADAAAVAVNATVVKPSGPGHLTLYPCDEPRPLASSLNYRAGDVRPNNSIVALSASGSLCVFTLSETDLVLDVTAAFADVPSFTTINPARLLETRSGEITIDGRSQGGGRLAAGSVTEIPIAGRGGVPTDAVAVSVNTAAVAPSARGYVTLFPCDEPMPLASSLNYRQGEVVANFGMVKLAADGSACVFTLSETHLVIDVTAAWTS